MLTDLNLRTIYDSSKCDLVQDLFCPLLKQSTKYDRAVGFFSSSWLRLAAEGLADFAENSGKARFIISPIISEQDWEALKKGDNAKKDAVLYKVLLDSVRDLKNEMEHRPLNALAWLIADDVMSLKFAIPSGKLSGGDFHDKYAIFEDEMGNRVAIHGSYNDSMHASLNGESFSVFKSWELGQSEYAINHKERFDVLWQCRNNLFDIYDIPRAAKESIMQLRSDKRPYRLSNPGQNSASNHTLVEKIELRDYQVEALNAWKGAGYQGLFEMATGTGKTITSIACANAVLEEEKNVFLLVAVPYIHLIEQWEKDLLKFSFLPVSCSSEHGQWEQKLISQIQDYNLTFRKSVCCIVTHQTATSENFQKIIKSVKGKALIGIFDEVHGLGAPFLRNALIPNLNFRIGLSATPARWFDPGGTQLIMDYFRDICYSFPLEKAIGQFLCPYEYYPHPVEMTESEFSDYIELSRSISKVAKTSGADFDDNPYLASLLRARSDLINNASNKISTFSNLLGEMVEKATSQGSRLSRLLFYAPVGEHKVVLDVVSRHNIRTREFIAEISNEERQRVLAEFSSGDLEALVAMKCLDQGVDVPSTETAFIIASTTNPIQFIQRRGRILRKFPGKEKAYIHDFVVVPPLAENPKKNLEYKQKLLKREMPRFSEFSSLARNEFESRASFRNILDRHHCLHLFDLKPWDIYKENLIEGKEE